MIMMETWSILDIQTDASIFEGQKWAQNDGFGSKLSSRKSSEVRLGPEWTEHLPRWYGKRPTGPEVIHHDDTTLGTSRKH